MRCCWHLSSPLPWQYNVYLTVYLAKNCSDARDTKGLNFMSFLDNIVNRKVTPEEAAVSTGVVTLSLSGDFTDLERRLISIFRDEYPPLSNLRSRLPSTKPSIWCRTRESRRMSTSLSRNTSCRRSRRRMTGRRLTVM